MTIETPAAIPPKRLKRRPGFGASVLRGMMLIARLFSSYSRSNYIPLVGLNQDERRDIRAAVRYIKRLSGWYFWKVKDRRLKELEEASKD